MDDAEWPAAEEVADRFNFLQESNVVMTNRDTNTALYTGRFHFITGKGMFDNEYNKNVYSVKKNVLPKWLISRSLNPPYSPTARRLHRCPYHGFFLPVH